ncbi:MAG: peptidoglycan bridge formation glycyltransferase FemA/FemB family protein [Deinococcaceae bacterium]
MSQIRLIETQDPLTYTEVVRQAPISSALQGWGFGEARKVIGYVPVRFLIQRGSETVGALQLLKKQLPGGFVLLYAPRGPVLHSLEDLDGIALAIRKWAPMNAISVKIEPPVPQLLEESIASELGPWKRVESDQPEHTIAIDLRADEATLLKQCHEMVRRNIKTGLKRGTHAGRDTNFEAFWQIFEETNRRAQLGQFPKSYYTTLLSEGQKYGAEAYLVLSRNEGKALAGGFFLGMGQGAYYLYGGSIRDDRTDAAGQPRPDVKAPTLFYWQALLDAKANGYTFFDFWGIPRKLSEEKHSYGVYKMKEHFGGTRLWYPAYSYDLSPMAPLVRKALRWRKDRLNLKRRGTTEDVL